MADKKIFDEEILNDKQLDGVNGGFGYHFPKLFNNVGDATEYYRKWQENPQGYENFEDYLKSLQNSQNSK